MTPEQFCYWMQGFAELGGTPPTPEQWKSMTDHLALVFDKKTPALTFGPKIGPAYPQQIPPFNPNKSTDFDFDSNKVTC